MGAFVLYVISEDTKSRLDRVLPCVTLTYLEIF